MPLRGEVWTHKSTSTFVEIQSVESVGNQHQVRWKSRNLGTSGKDTLSSFLERFYSPGGPR
jgi:hypothetical protein